MLLIPGGEEGPRICQSASLIRSVMVYTGKDSAEHLANNIEPILEEADHLERHGLRYNAELKTYLGQVANDGSKAEKKEGDRDVRVQVVMPADMAAHVGLFGCGGTRDKHFCSHCHCHTKERSKPFHLIKVDEDTTMGDIATQHNTPIDILWALNAHHDPTGMFPDEELTEAALQHKTQPTEPPTQPTQPPSPAQAQETRRPIAAQVAFQRFNRSDGRRRQPKAKAPKAQQAPNLNQESIKVSDIFKFPAGTVKEADDRLKFPVPRGSILRVMKIHQMDRSLPNLTGKMGLGHERSVAHHCFSEVSTQQLSFRTWCAGSAFARCMPT